jgi:hypothetical protein
MKHKLVIALCLGVAIAACKKDSSTVTPAYQAPVAKTGGADSTDTTGSRFISVSLANQMINSYLYSINAEQNSSDVRSFSIDADSLRAYLNSSTNIKNVKLVFAHTPEYINSGSFGKNAGYKSGALTIVVAGYDASGNYVYHNGMVLDHLRPCPHSCPAGDAGNNLLSVY